MEACVSEAYFLYEISPYYNYPENTHDFAPEMSYNHDTNFNFEQTCHAIGSGDKHSQENDQEFEGDFEFQMFGRQGHLAGGAGEMAAGGEAAGDVEANVFSNKPQCCGQTPNRVRFTNTVNKPQGCCNGVGVYHKVKQCCTIEGVKAFDDSVCSRE